MNGFGFKFFIPNPQSNSDLKTILMFSDILYINLVRS